MLAPQLLSARAHRLLVGAPSSSSTQMRGCNSLSTGNASSCMWRIGPVPSPSTKRQSRGSFWRILSKDLDIEQLSLHAAHILPLHELRKLLAPTSTPGRFTNLGQQLSLLLHIVGDSALRLLQATRTGIAARNNMKPLDTRREYCERAGSEHATVLLSH